MVKLYRRLKHTVTSSTLAWISVRKEGPAHKNSVPIGSGGPYWCRARKRTVWISGAVVEKKCRFPFLDSVYNTENFDVLVSLNGSARLINVPWDSFQSYPQNSIITPDRLLALYADSKGGSVLPGFVNMRERRAHFLKGNESIKLSEGMLVTEKEPMKYRLENVRLGQDSTPLLHEEVLQEILLENKAEYSKEIIREVTVLSQYTVYFGKVRGTVIALPTSVSGPDTFPVNITWGIHNNLNYNRTVKIKHELPGRSSVRVRLIAVIRNLDAMYHGRLVSIYDDDVELERVISGLHTERKLAELRADFAQTKSLLTDNEIDLFPPHSVVLLHSTTTTPAPLLETNSQHALSGSSSSSHRFPIPQEVGVNCAMRLVSLWSFSLLLFILI